MHPRYASTIRANVTAVGEAHRDWDDACGEWLKVSGQASEVLTVE